MKLNVLTRKLLYSNKIKSENIALKNRILGVCMMSIAPTIQVLLKHSSYKLIINYTDQSLCYTVIITLKKCLTMQVKDHTNDLSNGKRD